ncbi:MAG: indolepyruvate ferredoxin oxidoreductase [Paludibacteraceae bacterium]|nr:indolepyruvate ferredoxin oxidoreductase [Paludibacteraceae bacterium]
MKHLLLGDEAIAQGAIDAGLSGVYAYPGTPSTEITEYIQGAESRKTRVESQKSKDRPLDSKPIQCRWAANEKTAMEAALGMSYMGKRAVVCMKHVGMNVCADAFMNAAITGVNGGLIVVAADDPSMHSSQNEQDSRFYAKFAMIPCLEPSNQQEAYDMMGYGFELSERLKTPVLLRVTTRMAHSRAVVETTDTPREQNAMSMPEDVNHFILLPAYAKKNYAELVDLQPVFTAESEQSGHNTYVKGTKPEKAILTTGIAYNYLMENEGLAVTGYRLPVTGCSILKITQYPLPEALIEQMVADGLKELLVIEEGQPVVEEMICGMVPSSVLVKGRLTGDLPRMGELTPDSVRAALGMEALPTQEKEAIVVGRPPALCQGCGHRDMYAALNEVAREYPSPRIFGDIGCYTLGALSPFHAIHACVEMGASVTMAKGAADAGQHPAIAVIGDSTFTHSGMTGLLDCVNANANVVVLISDNLTTGMTGGQDSAGTGRLEQICTGIGVAPEHVRVVVPLPKNMEEIKQVLREEIDYPGTSVVIARRECIQTLKRHLKAAKGVESRKLRVES